MFVHPFCHYRSSLKFLKKQLLLLTEHGIRVITMEALFLPCRLKSFTGLVVVTLLRLAVGDRSGALFRIFLQLKMIKHVK